jgi:uncharacterized protein (DUF2384 family)
MYNDIHLHITLLDIFNGDEVKAFRWMFTPIVELNHRTPLEVLSDGGLYRVIGILEALKNGR